jgi:hypothetical protein
MTVMAAQNQAFLTPATYLHSQVTLPPGKLPPESTGQKDQLVMIM